MLDLGASLALWPALSYPDLTLRGWSRGQHRAEKNYIYIQVHRDRNLTVLLAMARSATLVSLSTCADGPPRGIATNEETSTSECECESRCE